MQNGGLSCASDASMRGRSVSNAIVEYCVLPFASGLLNSSGDGCSRWSRFAFESVPGQSALYDCPSQSSSSLKQPLIWTSVESVPGTQKLLSSSSSSPPLSWAPGTAQLNCASICTQFSKCPISSDIATLYVCADHVLPRGLAVEYSGWKAYGFSWQVFELGVYRMWPNPFAVDAVMNEMLVQPSATPSGNARPRSGAAARTNMATPNAADETMTSRVSMVLRRAVYSAPMSDPTAVVENSRVNMPVPPWNVFSTNSESTTWKSSQAVVFSTPVFWLIVRLSIVIAAQYWCAVQPKPSNCGT